MTARWALLVGNKGGGKSSTASQVAAELSARGLVVGGVIQEPIEEDGERIGYRARHVGGAESAVVGRRGAAPPGAQEGALQAFCSFVFDTEAFEQARRWIEGDARAADVVVIDEVSKLEVARSGHHRAIGEALGGRALVLLVVRGDQLFSVVERFELGEPVATLEAGEEGAVGAFVGAIAEAARGGGPR